MLFEHAWANCRLFCSRRWCIISFEIRFGYSKLNSTPLNWAQFCDLLRQTNRNDKPVDPNDNITGQRIHTITAPAGVVGGNDDQQAMIKSVEKAILLVDNFVLFFYVFPHFGN